MGPLPVEYHFPQILEVIGQKLGTYIGCEGLDREDQYKHIKLLIELKSNVNSFDPLEILSGRGSWTVNPTLYDGFIDITNILIKDFGIEEVNHISVESQTTKPEINVKFMEGKGDFYLDTFDGT